MSAKYGECLACGNITGGEEYEPCARCAGSPAAPAPTEPVTPTEGERERFAPREADSSGCNHMHEPANTGPMYCHQCVREIVAETWEEAAQVAEKQVENKRNPDSYREGWNDACWSVAAALRAKGGR